MRKYAALLFALLLLKPFASHAQFNIDYNQLMQSQNVLLTMTIKDAASGNALPYVTVYLVPAKDTVISHFTMTDNDGNAQFKDLTPGRYQVNAELLGYKPFRKEYDLSGYKKDIGVIKMEENPEYIDAATITAVGNPIVFKKDTVEYNADAFQVADDAMLEDLLKRMPGMEVDKDGNVTVNGEKVDRITVGGKTFFFNDPTMAVKNLPAKIISKIQVIDKQKDEAAFSGVSTKDEKEKVMNVQLKEDYERGWFGNASLSGGTALARQDEGGLRGGRNLLFDASGMVSGYNEKDQIIFLGNGKNVESSRQMVIFGLWDDNDEDMFMMKPGISTMAQAGVNYNTERVKGLESTASVNYKYTDKISRERSSRTEWQADGTDMLTVGTYDGHGTDHKVTASFTLNNLKKDKYLFRFEPSITFTRGNRETKKASSTSLEEMNRNSSSSSILSNSDEIGSYTRWSMGIKDMGRKGRNVTFSGNFQSSHRGGASREESTTIFTGGSQEKNLRYDKGAGYLAGEGVLSYVEPIVGNWAVQGRFTTCLINDSNVKDAFDISTGGRNDYYSSYSLNNDILFRERLLLQYKKGELTCVFGAQTDQEKNVTRVKMLGNERTTGEGEWLRNWAPYADVRWSNDRLRMDASYGGNSSTPSGSKLLPVLDVSDPVQITAGNIYLRPSFSHTATFSLTSSNPKRFSAFDIWGYMTMGTNGIVNATWFDGNGVRYAVPVNSKKLSENGGLYAFYNTPIGSKRHFTLSLNGSLQFSSARGYQALKAMEGLDTDHLDYSSFMSSFWGDPSGDRFYSGLSGFGESNTNTLTWNFNPTFKYQIDNFSARVKASVSNTVSHYSLDSSADMNTFNYLFGGDVLYRTRFGMEITSDLEYRMYRGYAAGFGDPELIWNAGISQKVKAVTISLKVSDILDRARSLQRNTAASYVEDTYYNVLGRYILLGVSFNFGKMNAKNNNNVQRAVWESMW